MRQMEDAGQRCRYEATISANSLNQNVLYPSIKARSLLSRIAAITRPAGEATMRVYSTYTSTRIASATRRTFSRTVWSGKRLVI